MDTLSGALMNLVANGTLNTHFPKEKEAHTIHKIDIIPNEDNPFGLGDIVDFDYLVIEDWTLDDFLDNIQSIKIWYDNGEEEFLCQHLPKKIILYLITKHDIQPRYSDNKLILPVHFIDNIMGRKGKIQFDFAENFPNKMTLFVIVKFVQKLTLIENNLYQCYETTVSDKEFKAVMHFKLVGSNLIINMDDINKISSVEVFVNGKLVLSYDEELIDLYGKKYEDYLVIYYNHKNDTDYYSGLNYNRIDCLKLEIKFKEELEGEKLFLATKTYNQTEFNREKRSQKLKYPMYFEIPEKIY